MSCFESFEFGDHFGSCWNAWALPLCSNHLNECACMHRTLHPQHDTYNDWARAYDVCTSFKLQLGVDCCHSSGLGTIGGGISKPVSFEAFIQSAKHDMIVHVRCAQSWPGKAQNVCPQTVQVCQRGWRMFLLPSGRTALLAVAARGWACLSVEARQACSTSASRDGACSCSAPDGERASSHLGAAAHRGTVVAGSANAVSLGSSGSSKGLWAWGQFYHTQPKPSETVDPEDDPSLEAADYGTETDWEQFRPQVFSIRPSVLSPLHSVYRCVTP
jgi:hypothetical protein